jgi:hypothetical protein
MALGEMHQLRRHGGSGDKPAGFLLQPGFLLPKSQPPGWVAESSMQAGNISSPGGDDTKLRRDETVFRIGEDIRKPALDINRPSNEGPQKPMTGDRHDQSSFSRRP